MVWLGVFGRGGQEEESGGRGKVDGWIGWLVGGVGGSGDVMGGF